MRHVWVCFIPTDCMVGPDYERHDASAPVAVKELAERRISEPATVRFRADDFAAWFERNRALYGARFGPSD